MARRSTRIKSQPEPKKIKVQKHFDEGWFEGEVTRVRYDDDEYGILYQILYTDGDAEEVDEVELQQLKLNHENDMINKDEGEKVGTIQIQQQCYDSDVQIIEVEPSSASSSSQSPRKKQKRAAAIAIKIEKKKPGKKKEVKVGKFLPHSSHNSSLWQLLEPIEGEKVTRELIEKLVKKNPPPAVDAQAVPLPAHLRNILPELHERIPEMTEFFVLMRERQLIRNGKLPKIKILKEYHWCNNYRELDRGTAYFRSEVLRQLFDNDPPMQKQYLMTKYEYTKEVLAMSLYYRTCNLIESFAHVDNPSKGIPRIGGFNEEFVEYVRTYQTKDRDDRMPFFTCAHLNQGFNRYIDYCRSSTETIKKIARNINSMESVIDMKEVCNALKELKGVNNFMSWQIACDLEECCCFGPKLKRTNTATVDNNNNDNTNNELEEEEEVLPFPDEFCELGPGANRGIRKIFGETVYNNVPKTELVDLAIYLRDNMNYCLGLVRKDFPLWKNRKVTLKVIEHVLCEYQKFAEIEASLLMAENNNSNSKAPGQRLYKSRAAKMDERPVCCADGRWIRCDSCHLIVCDGCQKDTFRSIREEHSDGTWSGWNCCHRCDALDQLQLL